MRSRYIRNVCLSTITMLVASAIPALASDTSTHAKANNNSSQTASRLLDDIKTDAQHVRTVAAHLGQMTNNAGTNNSTGNANATNFTTPNSITASEKNFNPVWEEYDRRWNQIKPAVEDMQVKLARLEAMESSLSPAERNQCDQAKKLVGEIQANTHALRVLLNKKGVQMTDQSFRRYSRNLRSEAASLEKSV